MEAEAIVKLRIFCFHSISFPNEWGEKPKPVFQTYPNQVSIQLVSPTSGEVLCTETAQPTS